MVAAVGLFSRGGSKLPLRATLELKAGASSRTPKLALEIAAGQQHAAEFPRGTTRMIQWPHAPVHKLGESGAYIVTAATYLEAHHFRKPQLLDQMQSTLFCEAERLGWQLQAWAVFSNHYHFVALSPADATTLKSLLRRLHSMTAREANRVNGSSGQVWHQYWDTYLTYERSYYARLNYVHQNPCRHGLVPIASSYPWCSAAWFERTANPAFAKTIAEFKTDRISIHDDFTVVWERD